jgi:hypothetical protein
MENIQQRVCGSIPLACGTVGGWLSPRHLLERFSQRYSPDG